KIYNFVAHDYNHFFSYIKPTWSHATHPIIYYTSIIVFIDLYDGVHTYFSSSISWQTVKKRTITTNWIVRFCLIINENLSFLQLNVLLQHNLKQTLIEQG